VKDFLIDTDADARRAYDGEFSKLETALAAARENIQNPERSAILQEAEGLLREYDQHFDRVVDLAGLRNELVYQNLDVLGPRVEQGLTEVLESAEADGDVQAAFYAGLALQDLNRARLFVFKFLDSNSENDEARVRESVEATQENMNSLMGQLQNARRIALLEDSQEAMDEYLARFSELTDTIDERNDYVRNHLDVIGPQVVELGRQVIDSIQAQQDVLGPQLQQANETAIIIALVVSAIALVLGIFLTIFITGSIFKQLGADPAQIEEIAARIAEGDLRINLDGQNMRGVYLSVKNMVDSLRDKAEVVERIANKDLTVEVELASENDGLGRSLVTMKKALNELLGEVNGAVEQVNTGAEQVSQASQSLSQGATEQASSLEEITSSANQINSQSSRNAENATEAHSIARKATEDAERGNQQMTELMEIMERINASSDEINKVVKVIDDIAFQINLLALNANVEAARAGKYGKGFAVVADEVRNLAVKSADSVKETTRKLEETVNNIKLGTDAARATDEQLAAIVEGTGKVANFLDEIAQASREQSQAIEQITEGLDQIDEVTQSTTASAEESASASEELAGQAQQLRSMVAQFQLDQRYAHGVKRVAQGRHLRNLSIQDKAASREKESSSNWSRSESAPKKTEKKREDKQRREETGIKPLRPEEQIKLDDDDFDRF
ncbi:MAG TPA: hypothetical protein ENN41_02475, partial [Sediminispirochaeta sp.]|nr:hypothetical protein [Sediminispirochaeta sp.]